MKIAAMLPAKSVISPQGAALHWSGSIVQTEHLGGDIHEDRTCGGMSHKESAPVSPSDMVNAVSADLNVEFMIAGNTSVLQKKINFMIATTNAMMKNAIQI